MTVARRRQARFWSIGPLQAGSISESCEVGPPQAGSILEFWPAAGGLDFGELSSGPAAGGLDFGELSSVARRRRARFWSIGPPQAGSISESCQVWPAAGGLGFYK